jgi:hypothetical protein
LLVRFPAILAIFILVTVRLPEYKAYFAQPNASSYVVKLFSVLFAYVIAIILGGRWKRIFRAEIFKLAIIFRTRVRSDRGSHESRRR